MKFRSIKAFQFLSLFICLLLFSCNEKKTKKITPPTTEKTVLPTEKKALPAEKKQEDQTFTKIEKRNVNLKKAVDINYLMGMFKPSDHKDFIKIDEQYADRPGRYIRKEAYESFLKMRAAALEEGITLKIVSAARNFSDQKSIWEAKWTGKRLVEDNTNLAETIPNSQERALKILLYSSMPGTSRHHWGTDIDLNHLENSWFEKGEGLKLYNWLLAHAHEYGWCQPYTTKENGRTGYEEEKWHWSYTPLSKDFTSFAKDFLQNELIKGFKGAQVAGRIDVVQNYVLGINEACIK